MSQEAVTFGTQFFQFDGGGGSSEAVFRARDWIRQSVQNNIHFEKATLGDIYGNYELRIPEYQRGYAWEEQQLEDLWAEIEPVFTDDLPRNELSEVFFGSVFLAESGGQTADIIDGQQRLTTVSIVLKVIQEELGAVIPHVPRETEDDVQRIALRNETLIDTLLFKDADAVDPKTAIRLNEHNQAFYAALMGSDDARIEYITDQESVHGNRKRNAIKISDYANRLDIDDDVWEEIDDDNRAFDESNKRILRAYEYFDTRLRRSLDEYYEDPVSRARALVNLKRYLLNGFIVGLFQVSQGYPSLLMDIFQILNDRGMDLNQVDIIRARIVARFTEDATPDEKERYLEKWERIIDRFDGNYSEVSDLLIATLTILDDSVSGRSTVSDNLLEAFVLNPRGDQTLKSRLADLETAKQFLDTLEIYSEYYHSILYPYDDGLSLNDEVKQARANDIIQRLQSLRTRQWTPLVLAVYAATKESEAIEAAERTLLEALRGIENVTFRQVLSNLNPNRLETIYAETAHEFDGQFQDSEYDIEAQLYEKFEREYPGFVGQAFAESLNETAVLRSQYGKALLWKLTVELDWDRRMWDRQLNVSDVHLEHFFPQTPLLDGDEFDEYQWFETFFSTSGDDETGIRAVVEALIDREADEALETIVEQYYTDDLGNLGLLWSADNIAGSNLPLSRKLPIYLDSEAGFEEATVNRYFTFDYVPEEHLEPLVAHHRYERLLSASDDEWESVADREGANVDTREELHEWAEERFTVPEEENLQSAAEAIDSYWTYERLAERKADLLGLVLDSLKFTNNEFQEFDVSEEVRAEIKSRNRIAAAEYGDALED